MPDQIGNARRQHPIPLRLRNCNIMPHQGGSFGYRGAGFVRLRKRVLYLAHYRSAITGLPQGVVKLEVDHIDPYRIGGLTPHSNEMTNFRVLDTEQNIFLDNAATFAEKKPKRRLRTF